MRKERIEMAGCKVVIAESVYNNTHKDFKGVWDTERDDWEDWEKVRSQYMGRRTWMPPFSLFNKTCLLVDGLTLDIISDELFKKIFGY